MKTGTLISIVVGLLLTAILLPIGLDSISDYDGVYTYVDPTNSSAYLTATNTTMATLVSSVIPIVAVIGIALMFIAGVALSKKHSND